MTSARSRRFRSRLHRIVGFVLGCTTFSVMCYVGVTSVELGYASPEATASADDFLSPEAAISRRQKGALVVDVRSPEEYASGHLSGALNIPHDQISQRLSELGADRGREIVLYCRSGRRAGVVQEALRSAGFEHVFNAGGYDALAKACKTC